MASRGTMRRLGGLLLVAALLGAAAFLTVRALSPRREPGLEVRVQVLDRRGRPVPEARAQARFAPGWHAADAEGRILLDGVVLRAGESPTPEAVARAVEIEAPSYAAAPGTSAAAVLEGGRRWSLRAVLVPYGRLRLLLRPTQLPEAKARVVTDPLLGLAVPEEGIAIARPGQPATWRVFEGVDRLTVRIEGMTGVALRGQVVEAPNPGFLREVEVEAEEAAPIRGRVALAHGDVPDLGGRLEVFALDADGEATRQPYDVEVQPDGRFEVAFAAPIRYRLVPRLDFADATPVEVEGGATDAVVEATPRPWLDLQFASADLTRRPAIYAVEREAGGDPWHGSATRVGPDHVELALPGPGRYAVAVTFAGDGTHPALAARATADVDRAERVPLPLEPAPLPSGTVIVRRVLDPANVELLDPAPSRVTTFLPGFGADPAFAHVPAGDVRVRVRWRDERNAVRFVGGALAAESTLTLTASPVRGRHVRLDATGDGVWRDSRDRILAWQDDGVAAAIRCRRVAGRARWETVDRVAPGTYDVTVHPRGEPGRREAAVRLVVAEAPLDAPVVLEIVVP